MSLLTSFFNLIKPARTDVVKVSDYNSNLDTIDTEMHRPPLTINGIEPDPTTRNTYVEQVPLADNLASDIAQINNGDFIIRTSGGDTSIEAGAASLVTIKGNMVKTGYVPEVLTLTVTPATREEGVDPITATIDRDTFVAYVVASGTITLTYTTAWSADPADYGITVEGTPIAGDVITVVYVKEERGTITTATPTSFNSTGWNLYDNETGYARVVAYSTQYGYRIGGTYSLVDFSTTLTGARTAVTVEDGLFNVAEDGYIFVTNGDATTFIYPTWSDWTETYGDGHFETYTVDTIDLSEAMLLFPYGLLAVGNTRDEINLNVQRCVQRIERIAYTAENLETVIESGVDYDTDTNYIYAVLENPVSTSITIDGGYTVSDHGIEFFTGTTVPVLTETLYGENLKDKLRTDVVTISEQTLTAAQQAQIQANLGVGRVKAFTLSSTQKLLTVADDDTICPFGVSIINLSGGDDSDLPSNGYKYGKAIVEKYATHRIVVTVRSVIGSTRVAVNRMDSSNTWLGWELLADGGDFTKQNTVQSLLTATNASSTSQTVNTYSGRKINAYRYITFSLFNSASDRNIIRNLITIPTSQWASGKIIIITSNHGASMENVSGIQISYASNTSFTIVTVGGGLLTGLTIDGTGIVE